MNRKIFLFSFIIITALLGSCKKDGAKTDSYTCATCKTTPDALAANDASSKGVYKGVVVGSTGTIRFDVLNGNTNITATMVIDGTTVNLTSNIAWASGVSYVAPFTGTLNGSAVSITFNVDGNGGNPVVTSSNIPGHPGASFSLLKESSTSLIESFEGTYSSTKPDKGTFNLLLSRALAKFGGISKKDGTTTSNDFDGIISSDNKLMIDGTDYIGTLSSDKIDGTFKDNNNFTVTVTGKRTL